MAENVVVLGAGMAGLAAARLLAEAGRKVLVLEAAQRVGGRIYTVRGAQGQPVELGAEFVHGRPAELLALIAEAGLTTYERTGSFLVSHDGALLDENARGDADGDREANSDDDEPLELLKTYSGADISFAAYVDQLGLSEKERAEQVGYVEGFNAADAREASVLALGRQQAAEDVIDGERLAKIHGGYAQLPEFLAAKVRAAGGEIVLGARVRQVSKSTPHGFAIVCEDGGEFHADHVVVALPLGVLRTGSVGLPAAAETILQTVNGLRMGPVWRMTFLFKRRLWPAAMSFLLTRGVSPAVWWTDHPGDERMLTGWSGGPRSLELLAMPPAQMCAHAESTLAEALGLAVAEVSEAVEEVHFYDWQTDPRASGSYSWVAVGGLEDSARFAVPVRFTTPGLLCFAGEHTDTTGLWGTVHAAYGSGLRAGQAVLREMLEA